MNKKIVIVLIAILAIVAGSVVYAAQASHIEIKSPNSLRNGDMFNISLTAEDGSPIANEYINITVIAASGEQNNISFKTDDKGIASFGIAGVTPGQYVFNCTFNGNSQHAMANVAQNITILE